MGILFLIIVMVQNKYLFLAQSKNRLQQKGLLKRFSINCYGHQETLDEIRAEKTRKFKELQNQRGSKEYEEYFLRYIPGEKKKTTTKAKKGKTAKTAKKGKIAKK